MILTYRQLRDVRHKSVWETMVAHLKLLSARIEARRLAALELFPGRLDADQQVLAREHEQYVQGYKQALQDISTYFPGVPQQVDLILWIEQVRRLAELRGDPQITCFNDAARYVQQHFPQFAHPLYDHAHMGEQEEVTAA